METSRDVDMNLSRQNVSKSMLGKVREFAVCHLKRSKVINGHVNQARILKGTNFEGRGPKS